MGDTASGCPDPPQGNVDLSKYMDRLNKILQQLKKTLNKENANQRIQILTSEMLAKYPYLTKP